MKVLTIAALAVAVAAPARAFTISGSFLADTPAYRESNASNENIVGVARADGTRLTTGAIVWAKLNRDCQMLISFNDVTSGGDVGSMWALGSGLLSIGAEGSVNGGATTPSVFITLNRYTAPKGDLIEAVVETVGCIKGTVAFSAQGSVIRDSDRK
jgi:hypothetical protein